MLNQKNICILFYKINHTYKWLLKTSLSIIKYNFLQGCGLAGAKTKEARKIPEKPRSSKIENIFNYLFFNFKNNFDPVFSRIAQFW